MRCHIIRGEGPRSSGASPRIGGGGSPLFGHGLTVHSQASRQVFDLAREYFGEQDEAGAA